MINEVVIAENPICERSVRSMNRFNPVVKFSLAVDIIRDDAAKNREIFDDFYRLFVYVDADVHCCLPGSRLDEDIFLFDIDLHPELFVGLVIQVCISLKVTILKFSKASDGTF